MQDRFKIMILECPYCKRPLQYYSEYADAEVKANKGNIKWIKK